MPELGLTLMLGTIAFLLVSHCFRQWVIAMGIITLSVALQFRLNSLSGRDILYAGYQDQYEALYHLHSQPRLLIVSLLLVEVAQVISVIFLAKASNIQVDAVYFSSSCRLSGS